MATDTSKNRMRYRFIVLGVSILVSLAGYFALKAQFIPKLELTTLTGQTVTLGQTNKKLTLLTFWASNCHNCLAEIPQLKKLHQQYHGQGFQVIGVVVHYDRPDKVLAIVKKEKISYPIVFDVQKKIMRVFGLTRALTPDNYLILPNGKIVYHQLGLLDFKQLKATILANL